MKYNDLYEREYSFSSRVAVVVGAVLGSWLLIIVLSAILATFLGVVLCLC